VPLIKTAQRKREGEQKPTRYYSKRQESAVAKAVGGSVTKNSGATMFQKGDVSSDMFLIECKVKTAPSSQMTIHKEWLEKNEREALFMGKPYSALAFSFGPGEDNHYVIDEDLFLKLCEVLSNEPS